MISRLLYRLFLFLSRYPKLPKYLIGVLVIGPLAFSVIGLITAKIHQNYGDRDMDRGAVAMETNGAFGENYSTPVYIYDNDKNRNRKSGDSAQGWNKADSLWFYNTTQGSALIPYDIFMALERPNSDMLLRADENMDRHRYLVQKKTNFNPDGLPVGFVKDKYAGRKHWYDFFNPSKDYIGYTCAACHTAQVNYQDPKLPANAPAKAIRIDGGPAMSDMVGFLLELEASMKAAATGTKRDDFIKRVLALKNDYRSADQVTKDLEKWTRIIAAYNEVNHSETEYHFSRLDAFGRIYNRALQNTMTVNEARASVKSAVYPGTNRHFLSSRQVDTIFDGLTGDALFTDSEFSRVVERLNNSNSLSKDDIRSLLNNSLFNEANAPVSYPFLWDVGQSDYVQWNGLASNAGLGPLGRNAGEVIGVFGILDWEIKDKKLPSLSALLTGQKDKARQMKFYSSIDINNLNRLERTLQTLKSPPWPQDILGDIDWRKVDNGKLLYKRYCQSCHEVVDSRDADRHIIGKMFDVNVVGTDARAAENGVHYSGNSGNFAETYQSIDGVGDVVVQQEAPVVEVLTAATKGVIGTPDKDKIFIRRWFERVYNIIASLSDNKIKATVKVGDYNPDTTAEPYASLLAYKSRSLNGIWATAPYLHNGSVPTLYDLMLPSGCELSSVDMDQAKLAGQEFRPESFTVGSRLFDTKKVGFESHDQKFQTLNTRDANGQPLAGNSNCGHEYGTGKDDLPVLNRDQRYEIIEYIKTLSLPRREYAGE